jgi:uncharacterized protein (DUF2384 family)
MANDENVSPQAFDALRARFQEQSRKAQAYYTVMHQAREVTGSDDAASAWMETPLAQFEGRTPAQLVSENRVQEVIDYISTL